MHDFVFCCPRGAAAFAGRLTVLPPLPIGLRRYCTRRATAFTSSGISVFEVLMHRS